MKTFRRILTFVVFALSLSVLPQAVSAVTPAYERQMIQQMHILDRPNRPGHFYGNTVRRIYGRTGWSVQAPETWAVPTYNYGLYNYGFNYGFHRNYGPNLFTMP